MRFLLVDDDKRITDILKLYLAEYAECKVVNAAVDAAEAFREGLETGPKYDVVFMDIMMPGMDGHRVAEMMRGMEEERGVMDPDAFKLVMVSAHCDVKNVCKSFFSDRADGYVAKPIEKTALIAALRKTGIIP